VSELSRIGNFPLSKSRDSSWGPISEGIDHEFHVGT